MTHIITFSSIASTVLLFLTGLVVFMRKPQNPIHGGFFFYFSVLALWSFGIVGLVIPLEDGSGVWLHVMSSGVVFIPAGFLIFTYTILDEPYKPHLRIIKSYLVISFLYFMLSFTPYLYAGIKKVDYGYVGDPHAFFGTFIFFFLSSILYGQFLIYRELKNATGIKLKKLLYLFTSNLIFYIGLLAVVPTLYGYVVFKGFPIWNFTNILYGVSVALVLSRRNVPDLRLVLGKFFSYSITISLFLSTFLLSAWMILQQKGEEGGYHLLFLSLALIFVMGRYLGRVQRNVTQLIFSMIGVDSRLEEPRFSEGEEESTSSPVQSTGEESERWSQLRQEFLTFLDSRGIRLSGDSLEVESGLYEREDFRQIVEKVTLLQNEYYGEDFNFISHSHQILMEKARALASLTFPILVEGENGSGRRAVINYIHSQRGGGRVYELSCERDDFDSFGNVIRHYYQMCEESGKLPGVVITEVEVLKSDEISLLERMISDEFSAGYFYFVASPENNYNLKNFCITLQTTPLYLRVEDLLLNFFHYLLLNSSDRYPDLIIPEQVITEVLNMRGSLEPSHLDLLIRSSLEDMTEGVLQINQVQDGVLSPLEKNEKSVIIKYLRINNYNKSRTSRNLNITINTLKSKMKRYGLEV